MAAAPRPDHDDDTVQFAVGPAGRAGTPAPGDTQALPTVPATPREDESMGGLMPMLDDPRRRFDTVMRGYDRHQVDGYVAKLEDDNRVLSSTRSESSTRTADLAAQLASAQAEIESLRRRVTAASEQIDPGNVDVRVQDLVAAAQALARQTRADAETEATRIRESATAAADALRSEARSETDQVLAAAHQRLTEADQTYSRKVSEADRHATEVSGRAGEELRLAREEIATLRATANQEVGTLRATATQEVATLRRVATEEVTLQRETAADEIAAADSAASAARTAADRESRESRESADAEAARRRTTAQEDFEITLRLRRRKEEDEDRERRAAAQREATGIVSDAGDVADRIVRAARAEVERLDHERHRVHAELGVIVGRVQGVVADHDPARNPLAVQ